jgi:hypothetical protein
MLLNNYAIRNANQSRSLGGNVDPTYNQNLAKQMTFYVGDNNVVNVTDRTSQPGQGYRLPYSLVLAPKAGGMSMYVANSGTLAGTGIEGIFATADLTGEGSISNAAAGLIVELVAALVGSGSLTASVSGQLEAVADLIGSGSFTAAAGALAGMVADLSGSGSLTGSQQALGEMVADIFVNQSEASVEQIVAAVWNAFATEYNISGTMGQKLNGAGSAGDPWTTDLTSYTTPGTAGQIVKDNPELLAVINRNVQKSSLLIPASEEL